jgi:DNA-binding PadR family transcriptional regulator
LVPKILAYLDGIGSLGDYPKDSEAVKATKRAIIKATARHSDSGYRALKEMEEDGLIRKVGHTYATGRRRDYYALTVKGSKVLQQLKEGQQCL